ncbi:7-cyano-7-deazaguanine synthase QueC [Candidatus Cyrtobacter comes]|nr:7-cyano-7-deazaguanine synthase QueC [Candidatus Cyrtobacter comes]
MSKKAIILLSGGLDSATVLGIAVCSGFSCFCISFDYGQRHRIELDFAKKIVDRSANVVEHKILRLDPEGFKGSALTGMCEVPKGRNPSNLGNDIPSTYVPMRNTIFISYALGYAECVGASHVFIGCNAVDYSNYPDCRPRYIEYFQKLADIATGCKIRIDAPLINMSKSEIIKLGVGLGVDYTITFSCYDPLDSGLPCGDCDSCMLRRQGFESIGLM